VTPSYLVTPLPLSPALVSSNYNHNHYHHHHIIISAAQPFYLRVERRTIYLFISGRRGGREGRERRMGGRKEERRVRSNADQQRSHLHDTDFCQREAIPAMRASFPAQTTALMFYCSLLYSASLISPELLVSLLLLVCLPHYVCLSPSVFL
jgi:hypothetical protein